MSRADVEVRAVAIVKADNPAFPRKDEEPAGIELLTEIRDELRRR